MSPVLTVHNIHKSYSDEEVLAGVSLSLEEGETKVIIGPSGTGKSTLLRCVNRLTEPDEGRVFLRGEEITGAKNPDRFREKIGFVFQHFNLFHHLTALSNVTVGPRRVLGLTKEEAREKGMENLDIVGLADKSSAYPAELSGGQKQRVGIARALSMNPELILFDEPTSALDPELIGEVLEVMINLAETGMTSLVVTHEIGFANSVANSIIFLEGGRIVEQGSPDKLLRNPEQGRTQDFLHKITELYGE